MSQENNFPRQRKKTAYRPAWAGGPTKPVRTETETVPVPKKAEVEATPFVSVVLVSTLEAPVSEMLLRNIRQQSFVHPTEIVVVRAERDERVTKATAKHKAKVIASAKGPLVAPSLEDQALEHCKGELVVLLAADLDPKGNDWLTALAGPLMGNDNILATLGTVTADTNLSPYNAYRFEEKRDEPLDFIAFRRAAWVTRNFRRSANLGHRWLELLSDQGQVTHVSEARATGRLELPARFDALVGAAFCNSRQSVLSSIQRAATETLNDWEALQEKSLTNPGPVYARAAVVRIAENLGKSRFRSFFTGLED